MITLSKIEKEIDLIKTRNRKVEEDKDWETSITRRLLLIIFTYLAIGFYLQAIHIQDAWQNAIVPALAFYFSTLTLPFLKIFWLQFIYKSKKSNNPLDKVKVVP